MSGPISAQNTMLPGAQPKARAAAFIVWCAAGLGLLAVAAAGALWMYYGTSVFFEMIAAGISACF